MGTFALLAIAAVPFPAVGRDGDFVIVAWTGPVTAESVEIHVILKYEGRRPVYTCRPAPDHNVRVCAPDVPWPRKHLSMPRGDETPQRWEPGEKHRETCAVDTRHLGLEPGRARIPISWLLCRPQYGGRGLGLVDVARPRAEIVVILAAPKPGRVAAARQEIEERIAKSHTGAPRQLLADILSSRHASYRQAAFQLLEMPGHNEHAELAAMIYRASPTPAAAHRRIVDYLTQEKPGVYQPFFEYWQSLLTARAARMAAGVAVAPLGPAVLTWRDELGTPGDCPANLPDAELRRLLDAPDLWVRTLAYVTFARRCGAEAEARLLRDLRRHAGAFDDKAFGALLTALDSPNHGERSAAHRQLEKLGDRVEVRLRMARKATTSEEVHHRIGLILARIAHQPPHAPTVEALTYLAGLYDRATTPADAPAQQVLRVLAEPSNITWICRQARSVLGEPD